MADIGNSNKMRAALGGFVKGSKVYQMIQGYKYKINFNLSKSTAVGILDTTMKNANNWVVRFDNPHKGVPYNHVNINHKATGVRDPHIPLPAGGITVAKGTAKLCKVINKVNEIALPVVIAIDIAQTGTAIYNDCKNSTSRNTVDTVARIAGGWSGGFGGAWTGSVAGSAVCPGLGTIIGGTVGAVMGGIGGTLGTQYVFLKIGDAAGYDVVKNGCNDCGQNHFTRLYLGEKSMPSCHKA